MNWRGGSTPSSKAAAIIEMMKKIDAIQAKYAARQAAAAMTQDENAGSS